MSCSIYVTKQIHSIKDPNVGVLLQSSTQIVGTTVYTSTCSMLLVISSGCRHNIADTTDPLLYPMFSIPLTNLQTMHHCYNQAGLFLTTPPPPQRIHVPVYMSTVTTVYVLSCRNRGFEVTQNEIPQTQLNIYYIFLENWFNKDSKLKP